MLSTHTKLAVMRVIRTFFYNLDSMLCVLPTCTTLHSSWHCVSCCSVTPSSSVCLLVCLFTVWGVTSESDSLCLGCVCFVTQVILNKNISVLLENIELLRQTEANLTVHLRLQERKHHCRKNCLTAMKGDFLCTSAVLLAAFSFCCHDDQWVSKQKHAIPIPCSEGGKSPSVMSE